MAASSFVGLFACLFAWSLQMKGPEAVQRIRELGLPDLKIFGLTGNVLPEDVECFLRAGADLVLEKPLNVSMFDNLMSQQCE
jgi:CheY-like chemotaxis protein